MTYNFYFDEAGYRGILQDKPKSTDIALLAGILTKEEDETHVSAALTEILKSQKDEPKRLIDFIKNNSSVHLFHAAIYCTGVYNDKSTLTGIQNGNPKNIYYLPFADLLLKLDEFVGASSKKLNLITAHTNGSLQKDSLLLSDQKSGEGKIILKEIDGADLELDHIQAIQIEYSSSPLGHAAKPITDMIYQHFIAKVEKGFDKGLNGNFIFEGFELADQINYLDDESMFDELYPQEK